MNEIAKMNNGKIAVADPFSPDVYHNSPDAIISSMNARKILHVNAVERLGNLDEAPLDMVKSIRRAIEDDDALLKDYEKTMLDALLDLSGFKAVQVQMKGTKSRIDPLSIRGKFAELVKLLKAREDAEKVAEPTEFRAIVIECSSSAWKLIDAYFAKSKGLKIGSAQVVDAADVKKVMSVINDAAQKRSDRLEKARASVA